MIISIFYYTIINIIVKPGCYMPGFFIYKRCSYEILFLDLSNQCLCDMCFKTPENRNDSNYFRF